MSMSWSTERERLQEAMIRALRNHWVLFLIEGIVLLVLGVLAVAIPPLATLTFTIFLGWLFLISGGIGLFTPFRARGVPGFWWSFASAVLFGRRVQNSSSRSARKRCCCGSCQRIGPSFSPRQRIPEAKKFASA